MIAPQWHQLCTNQYKNANTIKSFLSQGYIYEKKDVPNNYLKKDWIISKAQLYQDYKSFGGHLTSEAFRSELKQYGIEDMKYNGNFVYFPIHEKCDTVEESNCLIADDEEE